MSQQPVEESNVHFSYKVAQKGCICQYSILKFQTLQMASCYVTGLIP